LSRTGARGFPLPRQRAPFPAFFPGIGPGTDFRYSSKSAPVVARAIGRQGDRESITLSGERVVAPTDSTCGESVKRSRFRRRPARRYRRGPCPLTPSGPPGFAHRHLLMGEACAAFAGGRFSVAAHATPSTLSRRAPAPSVGHRFASRPGRRVTRWGRTRGRADEKHASPTIQWVISAAATHARWRWAFARACGLVNDFARAGHGRLQLFTQ
jgi:hypothetical protein